MGQYGKGNDVFTIDDQFDKQFQSLCNTAQTSPGFIIRAYLFTHFLPAFAGNNTRLGEELLVPVEVPIPILRPSGMHAEEPQPLQKRPAKDAEPDQKDADLVKFLHSYSAPFVSSSSMSKSCPSISTAISQ